MTVRKPAAKKPAAKRASTKPPIAKTPLVQTIQNRYDAAGNGRRLRGWNPPASGPNRAIEGAPKLRDRSRDTVRNDWAGRSGMRVWTTNLIGTGIVPRLPDGFSKERKRELIRLWDDWVEVADADSVLDFYGLLTLATKEWFGGGEAFVRLRYRRSDSGMEVPLQIQVLESDMVPFLDADNWNGLPQNNIIRSGIELNRSGQRTAIWFYKEHPGDSKGRAVGSNDLVRVAISQVLHLFEPERAGQLRGVPDFSAILTRLRNTGDFDDNVMERQRLANLIMGFVKRPSAGTFDAGVDPLTGKPIVTDSSGAPMVSMEPGTIQELDPGEEMQFSNPPEAGTTYSEYMRTQYVGTAAGQGLPYELMSGDIKDVGDRTLRVVIMEFRRFCEQRQWQILIPQLCRRVRNAWTEQCAVVGLVSLSEVDAVRRVQWAPHGWDYIHPVQDMQADEKAIQNGTKSRSSIISKRGEDPEQVDEERAADKKREDDLGLTPVPPPAADATPGAASQSPPAQNRAIDNLTLSVARLETAFTAKASEKPDTSAIEHFIAGLATTNNTVTQIAASVAALASRPTEVNVTNNVEPTPIEVNVEPAAVQIDNHVPAGETIVNVAPPAVQVTNNVQPAEVVVSLPDRKIESDITRDKDGDIINVVQIETTIQ